MAGYRAKTHAQDRILTAIVEAAKEEQRTDVSVTMIEIAEQLASRWSVRDFPGLPNTATKAA